MTIKQLYRIQGGYYIVTGIWPVIDIYSFMVVSGPKTDIWLVKMVGLLTTVIGIVLLLHAKEEKEMQTAPIRTLGVGAAVSYLIIDIYYALHDVIWNVYLLDAGLELAFIILWIIKIKRDNPKIKPILKDKELE